MNSKVHFQFKSTKSENYKVLVELVDKVRSCRRKLGTDNRLSHGDDIVIETKESVFKIYMVDIRLNEIP